MLGWCHSGRKAWCTNDGGSVFAAGTPADGAAAIGAGNSGAAAGSVLRGQRISPDGGQPGQFSPAHRHGDDLRLHRLAGGAHHPGGAGGLSHFLGQRGLAGNCLGGFGGAAGAAPGTAGGEPEPTADDSRHRRLPYGHHGAVLSTASPGSDPAAGVWPAHRPDGADRHAFYPGRPVPGSGDGLAHRGSGDAGTGADSPGGGESRMCGCRGACGERRFSRGSSGGAGTGLSPGDQGSHDGGGVPCLVHPTDSLRQTLAALRRPGLRSAGGDGGLRHLGFVGAAGAGAGGRGGGSASCPHSDSSPPGGDGSRPGAAGGGGGDVFHPAPAAHREGAPCRGCQGSAGAGTGASLRHLLRKEPMHPAAELESGTPGAPLGGGLPEAGAAHPSAAPCPGAAPGAGSQSKTPAGIPAGVGTAIYVSGGVFAKSCGRAPPEGPASPAGISGPGRRPEPGEGAGQRGSVHCLSRG